MSKERLEEIKERVLTDKVYYKFIDSKGRWGKTYTLSDEDYKYLIQQAERAQKNAQDLVDLNMQLKGAQRLNTRYLEALEEIASKRMTYADMFSAIRTAKEALRYRERTNETIKFIRKH